MYQYIHEINESQMDAIDKLLYTITFLTNSTEDKINLISLKTYKKLEGQVKGLWESIKGDHVSQYKGYNFTYDFKKISLGQYIEVAHFLRNGYIENMHLIAASISSYGNKDHVQRAEALQKMPFLPIMFNVKYFLEQFAEFNGRYKGLFGVSVDDEEESVSQPSDDFNVRYGWIYSAKKVAEFEGIPLEKAFDLPVIQAFNDLSYLKALTQYEAELAKSKRDAVI